MRRLSASAGRVRVSGRSQSAWTSSDLHPPGTSSLPATRECQWRDRRGSARALNWYDGAAMGTFANLLILVVGLDLEPELAAVDLEKLGADRDLLALRRGAEVLDVDFEADGGVPVGEMSLHRLDASALHQSYPGGGGEHALSSHVLDGELVIDRRDDLSFKPWCETAFGHECSPLVKFEYAQLAHAPDETTVDRNGRAGGVATPRRDQQRHHGRDVIDGADAAHRDLGFKLRAHRAGIDSVGGECLLKPTGFDVTGADGIDVDVVLGNLQAQRLGVADDARPRGHR